MGVEDYQHLPAMETIPPVPAPTIYSILPSGHIQLITILPLGSVPPPNAIPAPQYSQMYASQEGPNLPQRNWIFFLLGFFFFFPHLASIVSSFLMIRRNYFRSGLRAFIIIATTLEMITWFMCLTLSWLLVYDDGYVYMGWIFIVVWAFFYITFGIPRVVLTSECSKRSFQQVHF